MKKRENENEYVVLKDTQYYSGNCQHPRGWGLSIASVYDNEQEIGCIGTLDECHNWTDILNAGNTYLGYGEAAYHYRIAEIDNGYNNPDYQEWLDQVDWDGCPNEDGSDYDENCTWAEDQAYNSNGVIIVADDNCCNYIVHLSPAIIA